MLGTSNTYSISMQGEQMRNENQRLISKLNPMKRTVDEKEIQDSKRKIKIKIKRGHQIELQVPALKCLLLTRTPMSHSLMYIIADNNIDWLDLFLCICSKPPTAFLVQRGIYFSIIQKFGVHFRSAYNGRNLGTLQLEIAAVILLTFGCWWILWKQHHFSNKNTHLVMQANASNGLPPLVWALLHQWCKASQCKASQQYHSWWLQMMQTPWVSLGQDLLMLSPNHFSPVKRSPRQSHNFLWEEHPAAGEEEVVEVLCGHKHHQPESMHNFLIPRLCTSKCLKQLLKGFAINL